MKNLALILTLAFLFSACGHPHKGHAPKGKAHAHHKHHGHHHGKHHHGHHQGKSHQSKKGDSCDCGEKSSSLGVWFMEPKDGATVKSPFKVKFGVKGMGVHPAGTVIEGTGHHHLIINADDIAKGQIVPAGDQHLHYGLGQTEAEITLPPGEHTLTMQFADGFHLSYGEAMRATIKVNVE